MGANRFCGLQIHGSPIESAQINTYLALATTCCHRLECSIHNHGAHPSPITNPILIPNPIPIPMQAKQTPQADCSCSFVSSVCLRCGFCGHFHVNSVLINCRISECIFFFFFAIRIYFVAAVLLVPNICGIFELLMNYQAQRSPQPCNTSRCMCNTRLRVAFWVLKDKAFEKGFSCENSAKTTPHHITFDNFELFLGRTSIIRVIQKLRVLGI